jgi:nucleoid-associated protein YgaU
MKRSAYIGLGALLALMLGLVFAVNYWCTNNNNIPIDAGGMRAHGDDGTASGGSAADAQNPRGIPVTSFDPYRAAGPQAQPERLQIDTSPGVAPVPPANPAGDNPALRPVPVPSNPQGQRYTVQAGDNYTKLADKFYGSRASRFVQLIAKANPDKDSAKLKIGDILIIPPKPADAQPSPATSSAPAASPSGPSETRETRTTTVTTTTTTATSDLARYKAYTVKPGDGFRRIAKTMLGDEGKWQELFELNRSLGLVKDVNDLRPGQKIALAKISE